MAKSKDRNTMALTVAAFLSLGMVGIFHTIFGNTKILLILLAILNGTLFLFLKITLNEWMLVICFFAGIACSGLFPGLLTLGGINFPQQSGTTIGILGMAAGIGSTFMPWVMSLASRSSSLKAGFLIGHLAALIAFGLVVIFFKRLKTSEKIHLPTV
jgi:fucose permease